MGLCSIMARSQSVDMVSFHDEEKPDDTPKTPRVSDKLEVPRATARGTAKSGACDDFEKVISGLLSTLQIQLADEFRRVVAKREAELVKETRDGDVRNSPRNSLVEGGSSSTGDYSRTTRRTSSEREMRSTRTSGSRMGHTSTMTGNSWPRLFTTKSSTGVESEGPQDSEADNAEKEAPAVAMRDFFMDPGKAATRVGTMFRSFERGRLTDEDAPNKYIMKPNGKIRVGWEITSVLALLYDAVMTPWIVAWNPDAGFFQAVSLATLAFWMFDMVLNFFTGYFREGEMVMQRKAIALNYLRTWFFVDMAINSVDIITLFFELMIVQDDSGYRVTPVVMRVFRLLKVGKLLRVVLFMSSLRDRTRSIVGRTLRVLGLGVKLVVILLWLNHVISCMWYFIGSSGISDTGYTWLDMETSTGRVTYREVGRLFQYSTSLHWSITQMTPGSMAVVPQNTLERFFNVACLLIGLFVGALLVSQLSARMVKMQLENQEQSNKMHRLHTYLRENNIGWSLRSRVQAQILDRLDVDRRLTVKDVDLFSFLSLSLRKELCFEAYAHHVTTHTLFHAWGAIHVKLLESICLQAAELACLSKDDDLFTPHSVANKTYLILKGALRYGADQEDRGCIQFFSDMVQDEDEEEESEDRMEDIVRDSTWVSEAAIFLECSYAGTLTSLNPCELLAIDVHALLGILKNYPRVRTLNHHYAVAFYRLLTAGDPDSRGDIAVNGEHLLMTMPREWRMEVMEPIVRAVFPLNDSRWNVRIGDSRTEADALMKELLAGKAIMSLIRGRVTRTVLLVTIHVERKRGAEVLVRLARTEGSRLVASATLPGTKMKEGEDPNQAMERLLKMDLLNFQLTMNSVETRLETAASKTFKIRSRYMISTFHAEVDGNWRQSVEVPEGSRQVRPPSISGRVSAFFNKAKQVTDTDSPNLVMERLDMADSFLVKRDDEEQCLYGWVSTADFKVLKTPKGQEILRSWVSSNEGHFPTVKAPEEVPKTLSL